MRKVRYRVVCVLLIAIMLLTGCGSNKNKKPENNVNSAPVNTETVTEETEEIVTEEVTTEEIEITETTEEKTESEQVEDLEQSANSEQKPSKEQKPSNEQKPSKEQNQTSTPPSESLPPARDEWEETVPDNRYVVDYEIIAESAGVEPYKYGITMEKIVNNQYAIFNDGSKEVVGTWENYKYDTSTYNATDAEIQAESDANSNSCMGYYQEVLTLVNQIRAEAGVGPLTLDTNLCRAASMRALEMDYADYFEHARADGRGCFTAMDYYGCSYMTAGENIAAGYGSPASVVEGWKNSPGHYANMINPNFTKLGVGYSNAAPYGYSHYWVQLFSD